MIHRQRAAHDRRLGDLTVPNHGAPLRGSHGKDAGLWRRHNRRERPDPARPETEDGEAPARALLRHETHVHGLRHERAGRSEEHTSELQSLMRISYAVFCLKKKNIQQEMTMQSLSQTYYQRL